MKPEEYLSKIDPKLGVIIKRIKLRRFRPQKDHFRSLAEAILSQQISTKAADSIIAKFCALYPGQEFPTAAQVLKTTLLKLRKAGVSRQKAGYLKDLAKHVVSERVQFQNFKKMSEEEIMAELIQVKGIGKWTVEMFLMFSLNRPDVFSSGDLGLQNAIKKIYELKTHPDKKKMDKLSDAWKPHRTLAARYLWASLK